MCQDAPTLEFHFIQHQTIFHVKRKTRLSVKSPANIMVVTEALMGACTSTHLSSAQQISLQIKSSFINFKGSPPGKTQKYEYTHSQLTF